ncbi:MAG: N-acetylornithine carbamoyltransferase [Fimbriimonadaceae bacterium]|nr:N-acetylornithine carbamoyltransferase [Fimbriimonadaceae bacterium]
MNRHHRPFGKIAPAREEAGSESDFPPTSLKATGGEANQSTVKETLRHITSIADLGSQGLEKILAQATTWKKESPGHHLSGKVLVSVFFNPSLRTRTSFEAVMARGGGSCVTLEVGNGVWKLEDRDGVVMDGDKTEHLKEAVPVLSRYGDALAVRSFSEGLGDDDDNRERVVKGFRKLATVPVISMEGSREHPCQGMADVLTMAETFGKLKGLPVTLTWAPHVKPLPKAVPNSFLLSAAAAGCEVRVAHPPGFDLTDEVWQQASQLASQAGGTVVKAESQAEALAGSHVLYAKAWGPATASTQASTLRQPGWMPTLRHFEDMAEDAIFMHCLPTRRGLEVGEEVLDSPFSRVVDQAENRFHVQRVMMHHLLQEALW